MKFKERLTVLEKSISQGPFAQVLMQLLSEVRTKWAAQVAEREAAEELKAQQRLKPSREEALFTATSEKLLLSHLESFLSSLQLNISVLVHDPHNVPQAMYRIEPEHHRPEQEGTIAHIRTDEKRTLTESEKKFYFATIQEFIASDRLEPALQLIHFQMRILNSSPKSFTEKQVIVATLLELTAYVYQAMAAKVSKPEAARVLLAQAAEEMSNAIRMALYAQPLQYHHQSEQVKMLEVWLHEINTPALTQVAEEIHASYFDLKGQPRRAHLISDQMHNRPWLN